MWRSPHARISGPSLSRKIRLSAVMARKKTSDESSSNPPATPCSSVLTAPLAAELASDLALSALLGSTPRSLSQPAIVSCASERWLLMSPLWLVIPPITTTTTTAASAMNPTSSSTAPSRRGTRCRSAQLMRGAATAATTAAVITGATIASVSDRIQTAPTTRRISPTSSQAVSPRSRSQPGVDEHPGQLVWVDLGGRVSVTPSRRPQAIEQTGGGRV